MRLARVLLFVLACSGVVAVCALPASAQQPGAVPVEPGAPPVFDGPPPPDPSSDMMAAKMARERNAMRQKQIVEDTNRLLDLAKQLKTAVDKSNKDELSLDVVNTAAAIEKLAKEVKDKMRMETGVPDH